MFPAQPACRQAGTNKGFKMAHHESAFLFKNSSSLPHEKNTDASASRCAHYVGERTG
jgi:hypothetical protein